MGCLKLAYNKSESSLKVAYRNPGKLENQDGSYYPFGLRQEGICSKAANSLTNKYQYGGKELQSKEFSDGSGLEALDFGARLYDPQRGRWDVQDPLGEKFLDLTPYNYAANNPILYVDRDGQEYTLWYTDAENNKQSVSIKNWDDVESIKGIVSKDNFVKNIYEMLLYLKGENVIDQTMSGEAKVNILYRKGASGEYNRDDNTIKIDPLVGFEHVNDDQMKKGTYEREGNGSITSPAILLLHEIAHFSNYKDNADAVIERKKVIDPLFTNAEEKKVITTVENPFVLKKKSNGESPRTNHGGIAVITESPTSTKKVDLTSRTGLNF
jgi:RHS repeat-associated protein